MNEHTPKIRCEGKSVDPALIFSIDSKLFRDPLLPIGEAKGDAAALAQHHDEVETLTLLRSASLPANSNTHAHAHTHVHTTASSDAHPHPEEPKAAHRPPPPPQQPLDEPTLTAALRQLPKEYVYRVKGFIRFAPPSTSASEGLEPQQQQRRWWILNWAFGRWELVSAPAPAPAAAAADDEDEDGVVRLTVMGERGEVQRYAKRLAEALGATVVVA